MSRLGRRSTRSDATRVRPYLANQVAGMRVATPSFLAIPMLRSFWTMGSVDENGDVYDASMQSRTVTNNSSVTFGAQSTMPYSTYDGTNYLDRADEAGLEFAGGFTAGAWARFTNAPGGTAETIMAKQGTPSNTTLGWQLRRQSTTEEIRASISGDGLTSVSITNLTVKGNPGVWVFAVFRFTASTELAMLVNGTKRTITTSIPAVAFDHAENYSIGAQRPSVSGRELMTGDISFAFLAASVLSDAHVKHLYDVSKGLFV